MIKVYDYDAADGPWSDAVRQARQRYDAAGIPVRIDVDGVWAAAELAPGYGFCGRCRRPSILTDAVCDECADREG